jgi:hypothetical protein
MSLTSSQRTTDDQLDDLELKYEALDRVMRGDPEKETDGFIARLHAIETWVQEQKIEKVTFKVGEKTNDGIKWQVWGTILVAIITTGGLLMINLSRVKEALQAQKKEVSYRPEKKLLREIQKDKERHHKRKAPSDNGLSSIPLLPAPTSQDLR